MKNIGLAILLAVIFTIPAKAQSTQPAKPADSHPRRPTSHGLTAVQLKRSMDSGASVYHLQCLACHMADALGAEGMNPPLVKTKYILGDKTSLVRIVLKGMKGVDIGDDTYRNVMAPHADLTDRQIADVLTYVRNSFGNKASPLTAAEVKAIRAKTK